MRSTNGIDVAGARRSRSHFVDRARPVTFAAFAAFAIVLAAGLASRPAAAQPSAADAALAETLFRDGKDLMAAKQYEAACPKLAESNRLDPAAGTLLALALCHEGAGRLASAWVEFTDVIAASAESRPDRVIVAREHVGHIEPELSRLTVVVPAGVRNVPGLEVLRDGVRLDPSAWGASVPIDGGSHVIEARAPSRAPWSLRLEVAASRDRRVIEVPVLVDLARGPVATPAVTVDAPSPVQPSAGTRDVTRQRWAIAAGALGVLGLGTGAYFGITAIEKIHDAKSQCPTAPNCTSQGPVSTNAEGMRDATIADLAIGVGLAAGVLGLFLALSGRRPGTSRLQVVPAIDRFGASVTLTRSL